MNYLTDMKIFHTPGTMLISKCSLYTNNVATSMANFQLRKMSPRRGKCSIQSGSILSRSHNVPGAECGHPHSNAMTGHDLQTRGHDWQDLCDLTKPTQPKNDKPEISSQSYTSPKLIFTPNEAIFPESLSAGYSFTERFS